MSLILRSAVVSNVGLVRSNNEDCAYAGERLLVLADGIGGMPAGELASDIVVRSLAGLEQTEPADDPIGALRTVLAEANRAVLAGAQAQPTHEGMGTTATALLLAGGELGLIHVGDSRCYRYRDGELTQLTRDDTFVQSLIDRGLLTSAEARHHPHRSVVTQAVQGRDFTPSELLLEPRPADRFLLCSDGLSDIVADEAIARTFAEHPELGGCAEELVRLALAAGAPDNVTVIVAEVAAG